jgi:hypothetical protein
MYLLTEKIKVKVFKRPALVIPQQNHQVAVVNEVMN